MSEPILHADVDLPLLPAAQALAGPPNMLPILVSAASWRPISRMVASALSLFSALDMVAGSWSWAE